MDHEVSQKDREKEMYRLYVQDTHTGTGTWMSTDINKQIRNTDCTTPVPTTKG